MKRSLSAGVLASVGLAAVASASAFAAFTACSSSDSSSTTSGTVPPAQPSAPASTASGERVFAINAIFLGDTDRAGNKNPDAWRSYGFNLDNLITSAADVAQVCKRVPGSQAKVHDDGTGGIDNAFSKTILPLLNPFAPTPSKSVDDSISTGSFTILFKITGLTDDPTQTNTGLGGSIVIGGALGSRPTFTSADDWPVTSDAPVSIAGAYINQGTFVNGAGGQTVTLSLNIQGQPLALTIHKAIIAFDHHPPNDALNGTIAGVLATEELVTTVGNIAGRLAAGSGTDLCAGAELDGIKLSIRQASDIMQDGTQNPGATCDGISVGLGFTAKRIGGADKTATATAPPPDPCAPDAGRDGG